MAAIKTIKANTSTVAKVDGRKYGHAQFRAQPWDSELGQPEVGDGILGIDSDFSCIVDNIRGTAVRLTIDKPPAFDRKHCQQVKVLANCVYDGIVTETSDVNLDSPRISSYRGVGAWLKGGNTWVRGGHNYGGDTAFRIGGDKQFSGKCGLVGTQGNDSRIGFEILHAADLTGCEAKQCWGRGVLAKAKTKMSNCSIGAYASNDRPSDGYVGMELTSEANWSQCNNLGFIVGNNALGVMIDSQYTTFSGDFEGRGPGAVAAIIGSQRTVAALRADIQMSGCGGGIIIIQLGWHNIIHLWGTEETPKLSVPSGWSNRNNQIWYNNVLLKDS